MRRGASRAAAYHLQPPSRRWPGPSTAAWCPRHPCCCAFLVVDRPAGVCPAEPPAGRPALGRRRRGRHCQDAAAASVTGVRHTGSTHPVRVRDSAVRPCGVRPSGVRPLRVRRPGSADPAGCCPPPPVRCPAGCCPPPCPDASACSHLRRRRWDQVQAAGRPVTQQPVEVLMGCRAVGRLGRRLRRLGGRATPPEVVRWSVGVSVADPSRAGWRGRRRRPRVPAARPGRPGRRGERPWLAACAVGREQSPARAGRSGRVAGVLGLGGRPRWVVVVAPARRGGHRSGAGRG
jgi:hypothetical protein